MFLLAGNRSGYDRLCQQQLRELGALPRDTVSANTAVWLFCLAPGVAADYNDLVSLMERTVQSASQADRANYLLNTLGAILYRAGRYQEAVDRLDAGLAARKTEGLPHDWAFLALAHHRLGNTVEARRWRDKLKAFTAPADAPTFEFWNNLEIPVLLKEIEAIPVSP